MEFAIAFRSSSTTIPTVPAGSGLPWKLWRSGSGNSCAAVIAYRWCPTTANNATGTFTNATQLDVIRVKNCKGLGGTSATNGTGNSINYAGITMVQPAGNGVVIGAAGHRTATNVNTAPSGMTNINAIANLLAAHITGAVTGWSSTSASVNASSGWESLVFELLADGGAWSLADSVDGLSGGWSVNTLNKVVNRINAVGSHTGIRQFTGRSTGKWAFGFRHLLFGDTADMTIGFVPITQALGAWPDDGVTFVFDEDDLVNGIYYDAGSYATFPTGKSIQESDYGSCCIDLDAGLIWVCHQHMTDWNDDPTADPNAGTGGIAYTTGKGSELFLWHGTGNQGSSFAINTWELNDVAPTWTFPANASNFQPWDNPGATVYNQACNATNSAVATMSLSKATGKALSVNNAAVASLVRSTARRITVNNAAVATCTKAVSKALAAANAAIASCSTSTGPLSVTALANNAAVATLVRAVAKPLGASNAAVASLVRTVGKPLAASNAAVASLRRAVSKALVVSNAAVASLQTRKTHPLAVTANNAAVALLNRAKSVTALASNAAVASCRRSVSKSLQASNAAVATCRRAISKILLASNAAVASAAHTTGAKFVTALAQNAAVASLTMSRGKAFLAENRITTWFLKHRIKVLLGGRNRSATLGGDSGASQTTLSGGKPGRNDLSGNNL